MAGTPEGEHFWSSLPDEEWPVRRHIPAARKASLKVDIAAAAVSHAVASSRASPAALAATAQL